MQPPSPILGVTVLNPLIAKNLIEEKGIVVDILVKLEDGTHVDVEMQVADEPHLARRSCYYLARTCAAQLGIGDPYSKLCPSIVIFFLAKEHYEVASDDYHFVERLREDRDLIPPKDLMEIHTIEIPKLIRHVNASPVAQQQKPLELWGKFLYNPDDPDFREGVMTEPAIKDAIKRLEEISGDDEVREIARLRENALRRYNTDMEAAHEKGVAKGEARGEARGEAKGRAEGEAKARYDILRQLLCNPATEHLKPEVLAQMTGLTLDEVKTELLNRKMV